MGFNTTLSFCDNMYHQSNNTIANSKFYLFGLHLPGSAEVIVTGKLLLKNRP